MTKLIKLLAASSGVALAIAGATPAFAAGTIAGVDISNSATVAYTVGTTAQAPITSAANIVKVDRRVNLVVTEFAPIATTNVAAGQAVAVTTFQVQNLTNDVIDIGLAVTQQAGGAAVHTGTDNFDVTGPQLFVDTNGNNVYDAGTDTLVTYLDELAADATRTVFVVAAIPAGQANGSVAGVTLTGTAQVGGTAGSAGAVIANFTGANTAAVENVLADDALNGNTAGDGKSFARDDYTVQTAVLAISKQSRLVSDPINGTTNPKAIPGAVIEYCIVVTNSGTAPATSVNITDGLDLTKLTYDATYGIFQSGTYTGTAPTGTCNLDGTAGGSYAAGTVSGTLGTLNASTTRSIYFRATIQ